MVKFLNILLISLAVMMGAHKISNVETRGSWIYLYDETGHRYKTLGTNTVGEVKGFSAEFFVSQHGSWIYLFNSEGQRYKTLSTTTVGEVIGVAGNTFTSRHGSWIYTWDKDGKRIHTRSLSAH